MLELGIRNDDRQFPKPEARKKNEPRNTRKSILADFCVFVYFVCFVVYFRSGKDPQTLKLDTVCIYEHVHVCEFLPSFMFYARTQMSG
jgi:hypothetical protein